MATYASCRTVRWALALAVGLMSHAICDGSGIGVARADRVIAQESHWNECGTQIFTLQTIARDDGTIETVRLLGGVVGDIAMVHRALHADGSHRPGVDGAGRPMFFARAETAQNAQLFWDRDAISLVPHAAGTDDLAGERELEILRQSAAHWVESSASCGGLDIAIAEPQEREVGFDEVNVVVYRQDEWCRPAEYCDQPARCYEPEAAGITSLCFSISTGRILDADIELNAVDYAIVDGGNSLGSGTPMDLANTLTHELGHAIGLAHTCWNGIDPPQQPLDHRGEPVPLCSAENLPPEITEATMFAAALPGETSKASLEQDDIDGFCAIYPPEVAGCGCQTGPGAQDAPLILLLALVVALALRGRLHLMQGRLPCRVQRHDARAGAPGRRGSRSDHAGLADREHMARTLPRSIAAAMVRAKHSRIWR